MRKMMAILLGIMTGAFLFAGTTHAQGNLSVSDQTAYIFQGKDSGYFYAKIQNDGDEPVFVGNSKLVIFSEDDDILVTSDYVSTYPSRMKLMPGEYTYLSEFLWNNALKNETAGEIRLSVESVESGTEPVKIPCEVTYQIDGSGSLDNYLFLTFRNDSDQICYGYYLEAALYDTEGNLIYVNSGRYENVGLHPGSEITVAMYVDNDTLTYFESTGIQIGTADGLVYFVQ